MGFGTARITPGSQAKHKAAQQFDAQQDAIKQQEEAYKKLVEEQKKREKEIKDSQERTQMMAPPETQVMGENAATKKKKAGSMRGSLMAGDTGGYNPATGSTGRLGGRSLLG